MFVKKVLVVIPARYESTRFPGKPLASILGKSMISRVYSQVEKCKRVDEVLVATDHSAIFEHVKSWNGNVVMTATNHNNGTERIGEAISDYPDYDLIINVQGDEPLINPEQIDALIQSMHENKDIIATQCLKISEATELFDYNVVKLVKSKSNKALYFSRQAIPALRDEPYRDWFMKGDFYRHIGIYGFDRTTLFELLKLPESSLESLEKLEQLRWLENDFPISVYVTQYRSLGVDRPEGVATIESILQATGIES